MPVMAVYSLYLYIDLDLHTHLSDYKRSLRQVTGKRIKATRVQVLGSDG